MPSNLVLVLQCLSGAYSNFVAKISGIDTLLLLCNIQLYFPQYSFGLNDTSRIDRLPCYLQWHYCIEFADGVGSLALIPVTVICLLLMTMF